MTTYGFEQGHVNNTVELLLYQLNLADIIEVDLDDLDCNFFIFSHMRMVEKVEVCVFLH